MLRKDQIVLFAALDFGSQKQSGNLLSSFSHFLLHYPLSQLKHNVAKTEWMVQTHLKYLLPTD